jgi:hypothetical protein
MKKPLPRVGSVEACLYMPIYLSTGSNSTSINTTIG